MKKITKSQMKNSQRRKKTRRKKPYRKKPNPYFNNTSNSQTSLSTESLENSDSLEDDDFYEDDDSFEDNDFYEDDDTDNENNLRITLCFDFEIQAVTIDNRQVSQFGQIERFEHIKDIDYYDYIEDSSTFSIACQSAIEALNEYEQLSSVTITINNMKIKEMKLD